ncbi:hypothetical protein DITRI_Ditri13aG0124000 [Diplodiscus trichospermus]
MAEDGVYCCCHCPDPGKHVIEGTFEIDHSPWLCLPSAARSLAIRIYSQKGDPSTKKELKSKNADMMQGKVLRREQKPIMKGKLKLPTRIIKFKFKFQVVPEFGPPGAFIIENRDKHEFFLKSATLQYTLPAASNNQKFNFYCNSWVYPLEKTGVKRVFFVNELYLPLETPAGLVKLRRKELEKLRGGSNDERKPWDRIYQYDNYNDLGDPDNGQEYSRPVLGDHSTESRPTSIFRTYVPPDERMSPEKQEELRNNFVDALVRFLSPKQNRPSRSHQELPESIQKIVHFFFPSAAFSTGDFKFIMSIINFFRRKPKSSSEEETHSLDPEEDMYDIFAEKEVKEMEEWMKQELQKFVPNEIFNQVVANTAMRRNLLDSQLPSIIAENRDSWKEDKEFGRQLLAGTNPVRIRHLNVSPHIRVSYNNIGFFKELLLFVFESSYNDYFILDHHDYLMPFLNMINGKGVCAYATRTIVTSYWTLDTIEPYAVELSLPDPESSMVVFRDEGFRWELAKIHVAANDAAYHLLVSHWLHTHAVIEPFIIATRRQLSAMHPIHRLLDPHFKDTLHINALARGMFLNAGGILERTLFTAEFSMRLSSELYKQWRFDEQALPRDLVKRDMAVEVEDKKKRRGYLKPVLESYPYAKDGTEIWDAIKKWVTEYCKIFYKSKEDDRVKKDNDRVKEDDRVKEEDKVKEDDRVKEDDEVKKDDRVREDEEIQAWWSEIRNEGHGDQKEGWYDLNTLEDLIKALTTIIWITSGLHAAVNFGQYAYAGWPPNRPMLLRKFIPKPGAEELKEEEANRKKFLAEMMPEKFEMKFVIAVMDLLSRHASDEVYLGQRPPENKWEEREDVNNKFKEFSDRLGDIDKKIKERNKNSELTNRWGDAKIPYKLLDPDIPKAEFPSTEKGKPEKMGITGVGIPNSISI